MFFLGLGLGLDPSGLGLDLGLEPSGLGFFGRDQPSPGTKIRKIATTVGL